MTDIRSSGFDSPAQFREHMSDLDDYVQELQGSTDPTEAQVQIARLREDVRELRRLIVEMRSGRPQPSQDNQGDRFWLRVGATVAVTFILTAAVRYFRLGPAAAAAVPLVAARLNGAI